MPPLITVPNSSPQQKQPLLLTIIYIFLWAEPFLNELFLGSFMYLIPTSPFFLSYFTRNILPPNLTLSLLQQLFTLYPCDENIHFLMRFIGMMLIAFGFMHVMLFITCKVLAQKEQKTLVQLGLFQWSIVFLLVGDCLHIASVLMEKGSLETKMVSQVIVSVMSATLRFLYLVVYVLPEKWNGNKKQN
ncbi:hypothetical protein C9374_010639 [Naegleria lovaniensis]|uniref:Uncharacterized protein n=1 Tax=Naegleria lovaniensis TaxID=51637 RepID=A0AA88GFN9_NAELO|nr:uncharacterized protein C9374_010639 [Naegleria lovaniensis]KAG2374620.1 hypothetical protein C9374_010639 [Naegleria lovaniensis]